MAFSNGRIPRSALAPITRAANGEQAYLLKSAAEAFNAMNAESERRYGVTLRVSSARVAYRTLAEQQFFWDLFRSGRGALAAVPGTSNHGWGLAVDLATPQMRAIVDKIGRPYGWAKEWSDAPSEWWHIKWRSGVWKGHFSTTRTLRFGMRGNDVKHLQRQLRAHGFHSVAGPGHRGYGWFGPNTRSAVKRIQKAHHLKQDGIVGPATRKALA